jgi:hypothetical protein
MTLTWCADLSPADWITTSELPWDRLVTFGPGGFPAYARLRFIPDPTRDGQRENDAERDEDAPSDDEQLRMLLEGLIAHTGTPDELYFCLWEGWGLEGGMVTTSSDGTRRVEQPAFPAETLAARRVEVPNRAYLLFRGSLVDLGGWGATHMWPDIPTPRSWEPAFVWPADHTWCVAKDVDPHWAGVGGSASAVEQLVADARLDVVRADPREAQPSYR